MELFEFTEELLPYQQQFLQHIDSNNKSVTTKSRQMLITTLLAQYTAWRLKYKKGNVLFIPPKMDSGRYFIILVKKFLKDEKFVEDNTRMIMLQNGNKVVAVFGPDGTRGWNADVVIVDEAAFHKDLSGVLSAVAPMMMEKLIIVSTPSKHDKIFNLLMTKEDNGYGKLTLHYKHNPWYTEEKIQSYKRIMGKETWDCEMELIIDTKPTKPKDKIVPIRFDEDMLSKIGERLIDEHMNISEYIRSLVLKDIN